MKNQIIAGKTYSAHKMCSCNNTKKRLPSLAKITVLLLLILPISTNSLKTGDNDDTVHGSQYQGEYFLNEWTVHIPKGAEAAEKFARENGFVHLGEVIPGSNHFHMRYRYNKHFP